MLLSTPVWKRANKEASICELATQAAERLRIAGKNPSSRLGPTRVDPTIPPRANVLKEPVVLLDTRITKEAQRGDMTHRVR